MSSIYTKAGDKGYTSNFLGKIYSKADMIMELQGEMDEINAYIGLIRNKIKINRIKYDEEYFQHLGTFLKNIQYCLYIIGVEISTEFTQVYIKEKEIEDLEKEIDFMCSKTEAMKNFIYYSGCEEAALSQVIRTIVRKGERTFVRALKGKEYPISFKYINRLSDYFFALSRFLNGLQGIQDEIMNLK